MRDLQTAANPNLLAGSWVVRIDAFRPGENNLRAAIHSQEQRTRIGILRLVLWLKTAFLLPKVLAGLRVEGEQIGRPLVHAGDEEPYVQEHRRGAVAVVGLVFAIFLHEIALPKHFARAVQARDVAGAEERPNPLAVGNRRRRGHVVEVVGVKFAAADLAVPQKLAALAIDGQHVQGGIGRLRGQINAFGDDNGRRGASARDFQFPGDVFLFAPLDRKVFFGAHSESVRPTPTDPVGSARAGNQTIQDANQDYKIAHKLSDLMGRLAQP